MDRPNVPRALARAGRVLLLAAGLIGLPGEAGAIGQPRFVDFTPSSGSFTLAAGGRTAILVVDANDWRGVTRAAADLQADIRRVTDLTPDLRTSLPPSAPAVVIIGTIGRSALIDRLGREGKVDLAPLAGKWESFVVQTVTDPFPGVGMALVIAGSDKRGAIYGIYDVSEQIGVSPWYWWADVAPERRDALYIRRGRYLRGEPSVKYRGIFLNDEKPNLDYAGAHTLRIWMVDPGVVLQKIVVTTSAAPPQTTYLGPPESFGRK